MAIKRYMKLKITYIAHKEQYLVNMQDKKYNYINEFYMNGFSEQ